MAIQRSKNLYLAFSDLTEPQDGGQDRHYAIRCVYGGALKTLVLVPWTILVHCSSKYSVVSARSAKYGVFEKRFKVEQS